MPIQVFANNTKVTLNETSDFRAQGGEGAVYVKGALAYKVYQDAAKMIPLGKIDELAALDRPAILRPLEPLRDRQGTPVGYTMRYVDDTHVLCRMFPAAFRARHGLTPERVALLVRRLQEGVEYVHSRGILIVDLNEMNFLLDKALAEVYFIDVNTYQTPSYPATALMESVRDRHCGGVYTEASDWFSFAVVSFNMFAGIHPYKGSHPVHGNANHWPEHMERNLSVLNPEVTVPAAALPFDVIPQAYRDWYRAVLDEGKRLPPPRAMQPVVVITPPRGQGASSLFEIEEAGVFPEEILACWENLTLTTRAIYLGRAKVMDAPPDALLGCTPRLHKPLAAWVEGGKLRLHDLSAKAPIPLDLAAEDATAHEGRFYVKQGDTLFRLDPVEVGDRVLVGAVPVGSVTARSSALYEGVALQSLLGACYASLFTEAGACHQVRLPELDGHTPIDAKAARGVLVVVSTHAGAYHRHVFRFSPDYRVRDCRAFAGIPYAGLEFIALDTGACLLRAENDDLELFSSRINDPALKLLRDPSLGDVHLFARAGHALFARGERLYRFRMR